MMLTVLPVLNDREVQSTKNPQALNPRVIESPRLAIELGGGPGAAAAGDGATNTASRPTVAARRRVTVRERVIGGPPGGSAASPDHLAVTATAGSAGLTPRCDPVMAPDVRRVTGE